MEITPAEPAVAAAPSQKIRPCDAADDAPAILCTAAEIAGWTTLSNLLMDCGLEAGQEIPLLHETCTTAMIQRILVFSRHHLEAGTKPPVDARTCTLDEWDLEYFQHPERALSMKVEDAKARVQELAEMLPAANFLGFAHLRLKCNKALSYFVQGRSTESIREIFNIVNDFTPEEEEQIRRENAFCEHPSSSSSTS